MQSRTIVIIIAAAVVAFAAAFGIGKATSGSEAATGTAGPAAETFDVPAAEITAGAPEAGLPGLKPKPTPSPTPTPSATPQATATATPGGGSSTPQPTPTPITGVEEPVSGGGEG
jgi:hypothetical protein